MESNFRSLYCYIVAADEMNFSRAAKKLYITQQSLSSHVKKLEDRYGVTLFERRPALRLTPAGERLLQYARHVMADENRLMEDLKCSGADKLRLPIGVPSIRGAPYLPDIFCAYHQLYPNIIQSYVTRSYQAADMALRTGNLDVYFAIMDSAGKFGQRLPILKDDLYFIASGDFLQAQLGRDWRGFISGKSAGVYMADTLPFPVFLPPVGRALRGILDSSYDRLGRSPNLIAEMMDDDLPFEMCARGYCAGFISKSTLLYNVHNERLSSPIYALHVNDLPELSSLGIVHSDIESLPQYVRDYIDCAREVILATSASMDIYLSSLIAEPPR